MNLEKVVFSFFVVLTATLNFSFFVGDIARPELHNIYLLFAATVISGIATVLIFRERTPVGMLHLSCSLVADIQLAAAATVWIAAVAFTDSGLTPSMTAVVVSLSGGALLANVASIVILVVETTTARR